MKIKLKFFRKGSSMPLDASVLFVNKDGMVCEITENGDNSFLVARPDISYSVETIHE